MIYDIAGRGNGRYRFNTVFEAPRATYAGGGFDFTPVTAYPVGVQGPTDAWDSIYASANDYFLWCGYYKLPPQSKWKPSNGFLLMFSNSPNSGFHISNTEPLQVYQIGNAGSMLGFTRQTTGGSGGKVDMTLIPTANYFGKMCQLSFWRNAAGVGCRMKSETAETSTVAAVGVNNTANFSGLRPTWGVAEEGNATMSAEDLAATDYRVYRGWLEDLSLSGRDPLSVLNADWNRVLARKVASGGTIFA